ncbi:MAG: AraC family ligand binding domain-containing protein, partial [Clostridia bacterium]|nr:AraC family ligand binding domain-containing protein [Clostridia bacterium]
MLEQNFSKELFINKYDSVDLVPIFYGGEKCKKGHSFGPHTRNYYIIHFCLNGCGTLKDKFGVHKISAGELFIIRPDEITTYTADMFTPWEYTWIAFNGK